MDGIDLLQRARAAGLTVLADGGRLVIRGPRHAAELARALLARKHEVLAALGATHPTRRREPFGLDVRWGRQRGWLRVTDPFDGSAHEVQSEHAPRWWVRRAMDAKALDTTRRQQTTQAAA